jgi:hypothetical protein
MPLNVFPVCLTCLILKHNISTTQPQTEDFYFMRMLATIYREAKRGNIIGKSVVARKNLHKGALFRSKPLLVVKANQRSKVTQQINTASQHSKSTQQVNTANQHSKSTQQINTASQQRTLSSHFACSI